MSRVPSLTSRELVAALKRAGYVEVGQTGSHLLLKHLTRSKVVVPMHAREMKRGTQMGIIRKTGLSDDEFIKLL